MTAPLLASSLRVRRREADTLVRGIGPAAPCPFSPLPADLQELAGRETQPWRWQCGTGTHDERRYLLPAGSRSLADLALTAPEEITDWRVPMRHIGAALGRLHTLSPDVAPTDPPQGLRRTHAFLTGRVPGGRASALRTAFTDHLPADLLPNLTEDCGRALAPRSGVRSHGWAGLSRWFPEDDGAVGLVGEDLGVAAPEHDLAAVLAQVAELHFFRPLFRPALARATARAALLAGYATRIDGEWLDREIRLAVVRHVHDVFVHATCPDDEPARWAELVADLSPGRMR